MDYQKMWENLKFWVDMAIEEGTECGYDKEEHEYYSTFVAYDKIRKEMNRQEGVQNESN